MSSLSISALVTNCSARKSAAHAAGLTASDLECGSQAALEKQWLSSMVRADASVTAAQLYTGRGVRRMQRVAAMLKVPFYIASAGLGLLGDDRRIPSYDLSVSRIAPSAIQRRIEGTFDARSWWSTVQQSTYACPISDLLEQDDGLVIMALSGAYVPLLAGELLGLSRSQRSRIRLCGALEARYPPELREFLMPYDSRLDILVRGSKVDFAQRAAEHFILGSLSHDAFPTTVKEQQVWVSAMLDSVTARERPKRAVVDDVRIRDLARVLAGQGLSCTNALNTLRNEHGIACEQGRFRRIFLEESA